MRVIVIGGPRAGKSTYAKQSGLPHYCTDPKSLVKEPIDGVTYLPEGLKWSEDSDYILSKWFSKPGDWIIEGVGAVRALRKWSLVHKHANPCDEIVVIHDNHPSVTMLDGQLAMQKGVMKIWGEVRSRYEDITKNIKAK